MTSDKVYIIGIGDDGLEGLTGKARELLDRAELLIGGEESLHLIPPDGRERFVFRGDLEAVTQFIADNSRKRMVILATGDPLFYGTARYLCDQLGKDRFEVVPHVSSMQLAFARVKESWDEAYLTNLATQTLNNVIERTRTAVKVGIFTTEATPPSAVAEELLKRKIDYFTVYVCENLGSPDERVTQGELAEVAGQEFSPLNVMILVRKPHLPDRPIDKIGHRLFGNPDEAFLQTKPKRGLLTPSEVRSIALSEMDLGPNSIVWDVGAGSGSVAIEAAQIAADGTTYAIEMDPEDYDLINANAERFGVSNLTPVLGKAPEAWANLPQPDAIFVGGTGRMVNQIVSLAFDQLRDGGRIVVTVGSIENVANVHQTLSNKSETAQVWMINIARGTHQLERVRFESLNPTFLLCARKLRSA
jgi:precorrin-6Y C5,15-methyltransferase (decarboxylating)